MEGHAEGGPKPQSQGTWRRKPAAGGTRERSAEWLERTRVRSQFKFLGDGEENVRVPGTKKKGGATRQADRTGDVGRNTKRRQAKKKLPNRERDPGVLAEHKRWSSICGSAPRKARRGKQQEQAAEESERRAEGRIGQCLIANEGCERHSKSNSEQVPEKEPEVGRSKDKKETEDKR